MKTCIIVTGIVLAVLTGCSTAQQSRPDRGKEDMKRIQGTWRTVLLEAKGQQGPAEVVAVLKLVFKNDTLTFTPGEFGFTNYKFKLDATAKPPGFTLVHADGPEAGKSDSGTYLLEGDRLDLCFWTSNRIPADAVARGEAPVAKYGLVRAK